ncbi:MAG TPA: DUF4129 domain-containing protein [Xanthobacteraceae bacterium]|jgi:hypothetical protein
MRRCIAVLVAALALASAAPLQARVPEGGPTASGNSPKRLPAQSRPVAQPSVAIRRPLDVPIERIDLAAKDSIRALDLQTEFPRGDDPPAPLRIPVPEWLIWGAAALGALIGIYALRGPLLALLLGRRREEWEAPAAAADETAPAPGGDALAAADAMSREGRFVEAMHFLLLQSLADIREQLRETFADSLTSREILRGARLDPAGRSSLREIIAAVERTYFGGYPARGDDYAACRRSFDALRRILRGGALA